jgi:glycosyltransferase involved in cell wall biosynthesis
MYLFEIPDYRIAAARNNGAGIYARLSDAYNLWNFRRVARRIGRFVVSSVSTRDDLIRAYGVAGERIALVYPAIRGAFFGSVRPGEAEAAREAWTDGRPYVLHFSTGDPRDNTKTALAAFTEARRRLPDEVVLLVAGTTPEVSRLVTRQAQALGIGERVMTAPFVREDEMVSLYRGAVLYLDPTLYEGFGMQIVEAMACGVPVVASGVTSVPEIAGGAAILVEPNDVGGFAAGMARLLGDGAEARTAAVKGRGNAERFMTDRMCSEILDHVFGEKRSGPGS